MSIRLPPHHFSSAVCISVAKYYYKELLNIIYLWIGYSSTLMQTIAPDEVRWIVVLLHICTMTDIWSWIWWGLLLKGCWWSVVGGECYSKWWWRWWCNGADGHDFDLTLKVLLFHLLGWFYLATRIFRERHYSSELRFWWKIIRERFLQNAKIRLFSY